MIWVLLFGNIYDLHGKRHEIYEKEKKKKRYLVY